MSTAHGKEGEVKELRTNTREVIMIGPGVKTGKEGREGPMCRCYDYSDFYR
jgi:hypothetical protein